MKKLLIFIMTAALVLALCLAVLTAVEAAEPVGDSGTLEERQEEVHAAAELLRSLGVAEDDQAIRALSEEWWRCQELKKARYLGTYTVTGYDIDCPHCQGAYVNQSASGEILAPGYSVAMCADFAFGTRVYIEGLGVFEVQDRGVGPGRIDVACGSHAECYALTGRYRVWVLDDA